MAKRARATDSAAIEWRSAIHRLLLQQKRSSGGGWKPLALDVPTLFTTLYMVPDFPIQVAMQGKGGGHKGGVHRRRHRPPLVRVKHSAIMGPPFHFDSSIECNFELRRAISPLPVRYGPLPGPRNLFSSKGLAIDYIIFQKEIVYLSIHHVR